MGSIIPYITQPTKGFFIAQLLRLTHTSGLSYGCGFGEEPSDATERGYAKLVKAVDQGSVRWARAVFRRFSAWCHFCDSLWNIPKNLCKHHKKVVYDDL